jgi:integrase/recombinase XerD
MRILTTDQVRRLLAVISPKTAFGYRDRAMLILALHTGLRVSALSGLPVAHVSHKGQPHQWLPVDRELGKGRKERQVPLNEFAQKAVLAILAFNAKRGFSVEPAAPLLVNRQHEHLNVRAIQRLVQQYREMAGLDIAATPTRSAIMPSRKLCRTHTVDTRPGAVSSMRFSA